jgi:hypothetical protein
LRVHNSYPTAIHALPTSNLCAVLSAFELLFFLLCNCACGLGGDRPSLIAHDVKDFVVDHRNVEASVEPTVYLSQGFHMIYGQRLTQGDSYLYLSLQNKECRHSGTCMRHSDTCMRHRVTCATQCHMCAAPGTHLCDTVAHVYDKVKHVCDKVTHVCNTVTHVGSTVTHIGRHSDTCVQKQ